MRKFELYAVSAVCRVKQRRSPCEVENFVVLLAGYSLASDVHRTLEGLLSLRSVRVAGKRSTSVPKARAHGELALLNP